MQQVYSNVTKVMVESRQGSNLLYLPLDKIMQMTGQGAVAAPADALGIGSNGAAAALPPVPATPAPTPTVDPRARDARTR
jgi:membrane protease subunit HflK